MPLEPSHYYFCAWTDSGCLCGCDHFHMTIASAVACSSVACAGAYVIAIEKGQYRVLNNKEETEFQELMYGEGRDRKREFVLLPWKANPAPTD